LLIVEVGNDRGVRVFKFLGICFASAIMMQIRTVVFLVCVLCGRADLLASPEIPGAPSEKPVALVGGTIHPVSGATVESAVIVFDQGRITAVGRDVTIPAEATQIDVTGKHVYPGLFDAYTHLGLIEINSIRATVDNRETGNINPSVSAQVAVNPDSEIIPVTRSNGVLLTLTAPTGPLVAGKSAVMQLDGWTWEDLTLKADAALHIKWPRMTPVTTWRERQSSAEQSDSRDRTLKLLDELFEDARAYEKSLTSDRSQPHDSRLAAMLPVLRGEHPVIIAADEVQQIQAAVAMSQRQGFKLIVYGGYDAPLCAELLKKEDIPVIIGGIYRLPRRRSDPYDHAFTLPDRLRRLGIRYCISSSEPTSNVRNLPYHAAMAVAFGLPVDEAIKAITLYPAEILGVADRVGSLDVGKAATLFIADGDPLETATHVEAAFVQGRPVDLSDRHKRLWRKYAEKIRRNAQ
jgi:imidazolonepropionase-like amidohydrolase